MKAKKHEKIIKVSETTGVLNRAAAFDAWSVLYRGSNLGVMSHPKTHAK